MRRGALCDASREDTWKSYGKIEIKKINKKVRGKHLRHWVPPHKCPSSTLPQSRVKKQLPPQRQLRQTCPNAMDVTSSHYSQKKVLLGSGPAFSSKPLTIHLTLLPIYCIRKPYSGTKMFSGTQHQHFQYSVRYCRPPHRIPAASGKYLLTTQGVRHHTSFLPRCIKYGARGWYLGIHI